MEDIPTVSITTIVPSRAAYNFHRAMGFVTDVLPRGLRLIATCQHGHREQWRNKLTRIEMALASREAKPFLVLGKALADIESGTDLYFVLVKDMQNLSVTPFTLGPEDPPLNEPRVLYNSRNLSEFNGHTLRFLQEKTVQSGVVELPATAFTKNHKFQSAPWDDPEKIKKLIADGWIANRMFGMQTRPGYSGSPIWDDDRTLYGLNVGGNDGSSGDKLVCLPRSLIYRARQTIEGRLQRRLRELLGSG